MIKQSLKAKMNCFISIKARICSSNGFQCPFPSQLGGEAIETSWKTLFRAARISRRNREDVTRSVTDFCC